MSISAVSSYSYSSATQYRYFGTTISDSQLKSLMEKYGITQTGDSSKDLQALYQAMYSEASSSAQGSGEAASSQNQPQAVQQNQSTDAQNSNNVPWASLMAQVGLPVTGDLTTDYEAFSDKISAMQSSGAASQQDQATINQLISEASTAFVQDTTSSSQASSQAQTSTNNSSQSQVSGSDIQAKLNKMYFLG